MIVPKIGDWVSLSVDGKPAIGKVLGRWDTNLEGLWVVETLDGQRFRRFDTNLYPAHVGGIPSILAQ